MAVNQSGTVASTMTGARAKVYVNGKLVGMATDCSWSYRLSMEPVHILGRYEVAEIVPTAQEPVDVTLNGMRMYKLGPHVGFTGAANTETLVPTLASLLTYKDVLIAIYDRAQPANAAPIMQVMQCRATSYSSAVSAKGITSINLTYTGIRVVDESATDNQIQDASAAPYTLGS